MDSYKIECYLSNRNNEAPHKIDDYFKTLEDQIAWANIIEAKALSNFYNKEIILK